MIDEKKFIVQVFDDLGVDFIEGGWSGVNLIDSVFFEECFEICVIFIVFGMIKWVGILVENDDVLVVVLNVGMLLVCLVGKSYDFYVEKVFGIMFVENIDNIVKFMVYIVV